VADVLGLDPIAQVGRELGLGQPTGIGVVAEVPGIMPTSEYHDRVTPGGYTKGMALNSAIGQGDDNVTPLQLVLLYAAIATGTLYQPQLVRRITSMSGAVRSSGPGGTAEWDRPPQRAVVVEALAAVGTGRRHRHHPGCRTSSCREDLAPLGFALAPRACAENMDHFARDRLVRRVRCRVSGGRGGGAQRAQQSTAPPPPRRHRADQEVLAQREDALGRGDLRRPRCPARPAPPPPWAPPRWPPPWTPPPAGCRAARITDQVRRAALMQLGIGSGWCRIRGRSWLVLAIAAMGLT
jgi:hypothetical protein